MNRQSLSIETRAKSAALAGATAGKTTVKAVKQAELVNEMNSFIIFMIKSRRGWF